MSAASPISLFTYWKNDNRRYDKGNERRYKNKYKLLSKEHILRNDGYFSDALEKALELEKIDSKFKVSEKQHLNQGLNNRVRSCFYEKKTAVLKLYLDGYRENIVKAVKRKGKELFFLNHIRNMKIAPRVINSNYDNILLLEEIKGTPLDRILNNEMTWEKEKGEISHSLGRGFSILTAPPLSKDDRQLFEKKYYESQTVEDISGEVLNQAEKLCVSAQGFSNKEKTAIYKIRKEFEKILKEPRILYKYDLNPNNILLRNNSFKAFIDFEQCYIGTESIFLGTIFDCMHQIPWGQTSGDIQCIPIYDWNLFMQGYQEQSSNKSEYKYCFNTIVLMAIYNNWIRAIEINRKIEGNDLGKRNLRLLTKFEKLQSYLTE